MSEKKPKKVTSADDLKSVVMVDILYTKEHKSLFRSKEDEHFILKDYQAVPFFSSMNGHKFGRSVKTLVYSGIVGGDDASMYLAENGTLISPEWVFMSGNADMRLGGKYSGVLEIPTFNNPPGLYDRHRRGRCEPAVVHPMRILRFADMVNSADETYLEHRTLLPVIYADVPDRSKAKLKVWTPNKGFVYLMKTPIPFSLTSYTDFLPWSQEYLSKVPAIWQTMVIEWMNVNGAQNLYLGYDFECIPSPPEDEINRLFTVAELNGSGRTRLCEVTPCSPGDPFHGVDTLRRRIKESLQYARFPSVELENIYGLDI